MSNESLLLYCARGDFLARKERLLREIMSVDKVRLVLVFVSSLVCTWALSFDFAARKERLLPEIMSVDKVRLV